MCINDVYEFTSVIVLDVAVVFAEKKPNYNPGVSRNKDLYEWIQGGVWLWINQWLILFAQLLIGEPNNMNVYEALR